MAGASLVTSIFGNSPAFPNDWPHARRFRGVTSRVGHGEKEGGSVRFIHHEGDKWRRL